MRRERRIQRPGPSRAGAARSGIGVGATLLLATLAFYRVAAAEDKARIAVDEKEGGIYEVHGAFEIEALRQTAWAVLTDYEGIDDFVSSVLRSVVRERHPDHVILEQEGVGRVFIFSKRIHVVLEVREESERSIVFHDVCGRSFEVYSGRWETEEVEKGLLRVTYELRAKPAFKKPNFLMKKTLRENAAKLLNEVRDEIAVRERKSSPRD